MFRRRRWRVFFNIVILVNVGGHFGAIKTAAKVLQSGFHWPTLFKDAYKFFANCDRCQRVGNISRKNEMPLNNIFVRPEKISVSNFLLL